MTVPITYANHVMKHRVESWGMDLGLDVEERLGSLMADRFAARSVTVSDARLGSGCMLLLVETDVWVGARDFAWLEGGSLVW